MEITRSGPRSTAYAWKGFFAAVLGGLLLMALGLMRAEATTTLLSDDFTGTTIDTAKWNETDAGGVGGGTGNIQQSGTLSLGGTGWGNNYLVSDTLYDRAAGDIILEADFTIAACATGSIFGFGYGDPGVLTGGGQSYTVYYASGKLYLSRQLSNANAENYMTSFTCTNNVPFRVRLEVDSVSGATVSVNGGAVLATSTGGTFTNKGVFLSGHTGTTIVDNLEVSTPVDFTEPDAPANLTASPGSELMHLEWEEPESNGSAITDYVVEYKLASTSTWSTFADGTSTGTTATVTGLVNGSAYDFRVSAVNGIGTSLPSATATGTPALSVPTAPQGLAATDGESGQSTLTWSAPLSDGGSAITDYVVEYKLASTSTWSTFADGTSTGTTATVTGLVNGSAYDFRVSAVNAVGTGAASATDSATPSSFALSDSFTGTTIDTSKWAESDPAGLGGTSGNVQQNGSLSVVASGAWATQNGVTSVETFDRTDGDVSMTFSVTRNSCGSGVGPVAAGYGDMNFTVGGSAAYIFLSNGNNWEIYYWNNGGNQSGSPQTLSGISSCTNGVPTTFTIVAEQGGGASVYVNGSGSPAATLAGGTFTDKPFWIGGLNAAGVVTYDDVRVTAPMTGPFAPTGLSGTPGDGQVALSWVSGGDNGSAITDYVVEYKLASTSTWSTFADGTSAGTTATVTGLTNGASYNFRVSAVNGNGTSEVSSTATATPVSGTPAAPVASNVSISGSAAIGELLTGTYTYGDANGNAEATSVYRWLRADTATGTYAAIGGATGISYTPVSADLGKFLKFEVTPVAAVSPTTGSAALSAATAAIAEIDYVNLILSTGQSLSVGVAAGPALSTTQPYSNLQLSGGNGGLGTGTSFIPLVESSVETMSSGMANTITANDPGNDFDVAVGLHGVSGYTYTQLKKGTAPFTTGMTQVTRVKDAAEALDRVARVIGVTTIHGETDNFNGVTGPTYQGYLEEWQEDYETDAKAITGQSGTIPLFLDQMSSFMSSYANDATSSIPIYQLQAARDNPGEIVMVAPKYFFSYSDRHHLTNQSSRWLGEYYGKVISKVAIDHETWEPLMPETVTRSGNIIYADFHVPSGELAFDTTIVSARTNYGFEYYDSTGSATISSVELLDDDTVKVTLSGTPTGSNQRLRYAYTGVPGTNTGAQNAGSAAGNLRDTDDYPSLYGNTLYNWAVHFDEPITVDSSAPAISSVAATTSATAATISWTTDEAADTLVEYGLTSTYTASSSYASSLATSHARTLTGLVACTTYHFRAVSADAGNNRRTGSDATFTTACTGAASVAAATTTQVATSTGATTTLSANGRTATLAVPPGFASTAAYFQIQQVDEAGVTDEAATPPGRSPVGGYLYNLTALLTPTTTLSSFDAPITVTLSYDPDDLDGFDGSNLSIWRWDGSTWNELEDCAVDTSVHTVSCETTAFSVFGVFASAQGGSGSVTYRCHDRAALNYSRLGKGKDSLCRYAREDRGEEAPEPVAPAATPAPAAPAGSASFARDLQLGSTGEDVRALQRWLNGNGFPVASTGPGSPGSETELFGYATKAALAAYQASKGISPAAGYFGPLTRASLGGTPSAPAATPAPAAPAGSASFSRDLQIGSTGPDVRALQRWLNGNGFPVAASGPGSPGSETELFGAATRAALAAYQASKGISPAAGYFGPLTRGTIK